MKNDCSWRASLDGIHKTLTLLLIDDTPKNIEGARNAGWQTLPYGDYSSGQIGNAAELNKALGLA